MPTGENLELLTDARTGLAAMLAEDRLADALHAAANTVQRATLPPLPPHDPERLRGPNRPRRLRRAWLAPIGAAIAVSLAAPVSVTIAWRTGHAPISSAGLPRYYVVLPTTHRMPPLPVRSSRCATPPPATCATRSR